MDRQASVGWSRGAESGGALRGQRRRRWHSTARIDSGLGDLVGAAGRGRRGRRDASCARPRRQRIDTAPFYGWGRAEEIIGRALAGRRDDVLLFTKCGTFRDGDNLRPECIRRDLEASLARLRTDHVDLLQFHDPDPSTPIEESWGALQELVREGRCVTAGCRIMRPRRGRRLRAGS